MSALIAIQQVPDKQLSWENKMSCWLMGLFHSNILNCHDKKIQVLKKDQWLIMTMNHISSHSLKKKYSYLWYSSSYTQNKMSAGAVTPQSGESRLLNTTLSITDNYCKCTTTKNSDSSF